MRSNEQGLRVLSLDHLGTIAARLRKDAVTSTKQDNDEIIDILSKVDKVNITCHIYNSCMCNLHLKVLQCRMESKTPSPTEIGQLVYHIYILLHMYCMDFLYVTKCST